MYGWNDTGSGMWIMMFLVFVVFLVLFGGFAALVVMALRHGHAEPASPHLTSTSRAFAILDERLARGEISPQEHQTLRSIIASGQAAESSRE